MMYVLEVMKSSYTSLLFPMSSSIGVLLKCRLQTAEPIFFSIFFFKKVSEEEAIFEIFNYKVK